jgi:hypothetical protein
LLEAAFAGFVPDSARVFAWRYRVGLKPLLISDVLLLRFQAWQMHLFCNAIAEQSKMVVSKMGDRR